MSSLCKLQIYLRQKCKVLLGSPLRERISGDPKPRERNKRKIAIVLAVSLVGIGANVCKSEAANETSSPSVHPRRRGKQHVRLARMMLPAIR